MNDTPQNPEEDALAPIVVDLGKVRRKQVKSLKRGKGKLFEEVAEVVRELEGELEDQRGVLPIIVLYERKRKKKNFFDF